MNKWILVVCMCPVFVLGATTAQAVTIDLSSPQDGAVLYPGDTVQVTLTVTNDTNKRDRINLTTSATADGFPMPVPVNYRSKLNLKAGRTWTQTLTTTVPADQVLAGPVVVSITVTATSRKTGDSASDTISATVAPLP